MHGVVGRTRIVPLAVALLLVLGCASGSTPPDAKSAVATAGAKVSEVQPTAAAKIAEVKPTVEAAAADARTAAATAAAKVAEAKPAGPARKVKVTQAAATLAFMQINVARHKGFFAEQGLDVEQLATGGGGPDLQALISGDAEFNAGAGIYQADAFRQGQRIINVFNYLDKNVVNVAMHVDVAREKGITEQSPLKDKLAALQGLKFGATRPGALTFQQAEYHVRSAGLKPQDDVQVVGAGEGPALLAALETRQVDVILQTIPVAEQAVARGKAILLINNARGEDPDLVPFNMENVFTRPDLADKDPELVQSFVNGVKAANDWILRTSPEEIAAAIKPDFAQMEDAVLVAGVANVKAATNPSGILDKKAVENTLQMQQQTLSVDEVYNLFVDRFVKAAQ